MISLVLTNRDRNLQIVEKSLKSLSVQSDKDFKVFLIDYGSKLDYIDNLKELTKAYNFLELVICPVQGQLWNKSRAINIALKRTTSPFFLVGDIDLIFHSDFINIAKGLANSKEIHYFQYGFLSKSEAAQDKDFNSYEVDFKGNEGVTGTTLFPKEFLMEINGYDEFYHGWGAEDTDVHIRFKNSGFPVIFHNERILVKHQWHPKAYRSNKSNNPFHSTLEKVNNSYMHFTSQSKRSKVNIHREWGMQPLDIDYRILMKNVSDHSFEVTCDDTSITAMLMQFRNFENEIVEILIKEISIKEKFKQFLKKIFRKKYKNYLDLQVINNKILEEVISFYPNHPYIYSFDREKNIIKFKIKF